MTVRSKIESFVQRFEDRASALVRDAGELCKYGEWGIAFENLLTNLHEDDIPVTQVELEVAENITRDLGLSVMVVEALRGAGIDAQGRRNAIVFTLAYCDTRERFHQILGAVLKLPDGYGYSWDALRGAVARVDLMPHTIKLWAWDLFAARRPLDAHTLLSILLEAKPETPNSAAIVELYSADDEPISPREELCRLRLVSDI